MLAPAPSLTVEPPTVTQSARELSDMLNLPAEWCQFAISTKGGADRAGSWLLEHVGVAGDMCVLPWHAHTWTCMACKRRDRACVLCCAVPQV